MGRAEKGEGGPCGIAEAKKALQNDGSEGIRLHAVAVVDSHCTPDCNQNPDDSTLCKCSETKMQLGSYNGSF